MSLELKGLASLLGKSAHITDRVRGFRSFLCCSDTYVSDRLILDRNSEAEMFLIFQRVRY